MCKKQSALKTIVITLIIFLILTRICLKFNKIRIWFLYKVHYKILIQKYPILIYIYIVFLLYKTSSYK